ncbi:MAG: hypothetical protein ABSB88_05990 [Bryobacteraceae bacterium]|jgi:GH24 family phage-related lysozyme (muramidase)
MLEGLKARLRQHEGVIPHLYLDTLGLVTCGVGHMVPSPDQMAGIAMVCGSEVATLAQKEAEFAHVKSLEASKLPAYYAQRTTLRMTPEAIDALQESDVESFRAALCHFLPGFTEFPEPAQEALLDMAFQLGAGGLVSKFPHLIAAVKARDWNGCAANCHRAGIQEWRNEATVKLFQQAA